MGERTAGIVKDEEDRRRLVWVVLQWRNQRGEMGGVHGSPETLDKLLSRVRSSCASNALILTISGERDGKRFHELQKEKILKRNANEKFEHAAELKLLEKQAKNHFFTVSTT